MNKLDLTYYYTDNGNCRVYYRSQNKNLYCLQDDSPFGKTGTVFALHVCSKDGEPSHQIPIERIAQIDVPKGDSSTDKEVECFLASYPYKKDGEVAHHENH